MNKEAHRVSTLAALDALPPPQQDLWRSERTALAGEYSLYGDAYALDPETLGPFVEFPDGTLPDFTMPKLRWKHHYDAGIDYWETPFYDRALGTFQYFTERIVAAIREQDLTTAARFAGTMAHYIQDNACPGHAVDDSDLETIKDLLPPPEQMRRLPFHAMMETSPAPFSLAGYRPRFCGNSIPEASSNLIERFIAMNLFARNAIVPFFEAFYREDKAQAAELNMAVSRFASEVYADYLHTVTAIATDGVGDKTEAAVKHLSRMYPYRQTAWAGGPYSQLGPGELCGVNLSESYESVPCELLSLDGEKIQATAVPDSLGATAYFEYEFKLPVGVYAQFSVDYGIHATLGARYPIRFEIYAGNRNLWYDSRRAGEPAGSVLLDWPVDAVCLRLVTTVDDDFELPRINGRPTGLTGHAVWANPHLMKKCREQPEEQNDSGPGAECLSARIPPPVIPETSGKDAARRDRGLRSRRVPHENPSA